jgi:hypothetical protein
MVRPRQEDWEEQWADSQAPLPETPVCPCCGGEVTFSVTGISGARPEFQMTARCDRCGLVEIERDDAEDLAPIPAQHSFLPPPTEFQQRARGLRLGDVRGAVRARRAPQKAVGGYLDPQSGPTRPM